MTSKRSGPRVLARTTVVALVSAALTVGLGASAQADPGHLPPPPPTYGHGLQPGNLLVSRSVFENDPNLKKGETLLAPGCTPPNCGVAVANGVYPEVFNNDSVDEHFGITSKIFLDQLTPLGFPINSLEVPNSSEPGITPSSDQMVTSFSSKSELALNLSTGGRYVTFMGYDAPSDEIDTSNGSTPGVFDPTDTDPVTAYRTVAQVDAAGNFKFTNTNAFSGDNPRAAILNEAAGTNLIYAAGNSGNGSKPIPAGIVAGGGAQIITPSLKSEILQEPAFPTPVGSFNITELGDAHDKQSKDNNYRGIAVFNNVLYYTKGSGGNGVNTVYFVDTTGKACPTGVGLPAPGAKLPSAAIEPLAEALAHEELKPDDMCILKGFPTELKSTTSFPFGLWFANADTVYVADEGNGENTYSTTSGEYTEAAADTNSGLQKWVFNPAAGEWKHVYTLQAGLDLGKPYTVPGYPSGENPATGLPWSPATDGLRNLTGRVYGNIATIYAVTSTVSGGGDEGADPDKLVAIIDPLSATTPAPWERFVTLKTAGFGEVLRGVSFTPGTGESWDGFGQGPGQGQGQGHQWTDQYDGR
jgi:hypothetical protein